MGCQRRTKISRRELGRNALKMTPYGSKISCVIRIIHRDLNCTALRKTAEMMGCLRLIKAHRFFSASLHLFEVLVLHRLPFHVFGMKWTRLCC